MLKFGNDILKVGDDWLIQALPVNIRCVTYGGFMYNVNISCSVLTPGTIYQGQTITVGIHNVDNPEYWDKYLCINWYYPPDYPGPFAPSEIIVPGPYDKSEYTVDVTIPITPFIPSEYLFFVLRAG